MDVENGNPRISRRGGVRVVYTQPSSFPTLGIHGGFARKALLYNISSQTSFCFDTRTTFKRMHS